MIARTLTALALVFALGCASFDPEAVRERKEGIEQTYSVAVDVSKTSPLLGNTMKTLDRIERSLEVFPEGYRRKIARINVVESFFNRYGLLSSGIGAYTEDEIPEKYRQIFVKNKSLLEDITGVLAMDVGLHIEHEAWHSVEYYEIQLLEDMIRARAKGNLKSLWDVLSRTDEVLPNLTPAEVDAAAVRAGTADGQRQLRAYVWLIKGWLAAHFEDVDRNGVIDDADMHAIDVNRAKYDADKDGRLTYADVARLTKYHYMEKENPLDPGLQLGLTAAMFGFHGTGFVTFYAQNYTYEDRAEVVDRVAAWKLVPWLYRTGDTARTEKAWKKLAEIRKADPVIARKVELMVRYIALHEDPARLNDRWTRTFGALGEAPLTPAISAAR